MNRRGCLSLESQRQVLFFRRIQSSFPPFFSFSYFKLGVYQVSRTQRLTLKLRFNLRLDYVGLHTCIISAGLSTTSPLLHMRTRGELELELELEWCECVNALQTVYYSL